MSVSTKLSGACMLHPKRMSIRCPNQSHLQSMEDLRQYFWRRKTKSKKRKRRKLNLTLKVTKIGWEVLCHRNLEQERAQLNAGDNAQKVETLISLNLNQRHLNLWYCKGPRSIELQRISTQGGFAKQASYQETLYLKNYSLHLSKTTYFESWCKYQTRSWLQDSSLVPTQSRGSIILQISLLVALNRLQEAHITICNWTPSIWHSKIDYIQHWSMMHRYQKSCLNSTIERTIRSWI